MTIDALLARRQAKRIHASGNVEKARSRLDQSRFLAKHFAAYDMLRPHLFNPDQHPAFDKINQARHVIEFLIAQKWLQRHGADTWRIDDDDIRSYLSGGWLEELVYFAHIEAGVDEAYFSQEIEWRLGDVVGSNEIDVIARRGDVLSFTSCKTLRAYKASTNQMSQLRGHLTETDYWNIHFANDQGRALLVVTADFLDEMHNNRPRYPQLLARATILEVTLAGLEMLRWERLVETVEKHWE